MRWHIFTSYRYNHTLSLMVLCCFFLLPACKSTKKTGATKLKKRKTAYLLEQLHKNKKTADWWSAKAKISYADDYQSINMISHIRMRKDSIIWMNFKKLGVEAVRLQITPDSIALINRLDKTYSVKGYQFITDQLALPKMVAQHFDFQALQQFLLGNPVFIPVEKMDADIDKHQYLLHGQYDSIDADYWIDGTNYELASLQFKDHQTGKQAKYRFSNYQMTPNNQNISYFRTMLLQGTPLGKIEVDIKLSKVELNVPKTIRFSIPSHYQSLD